jgi:hypothetical protein
MKYFDDPEHEKWRGHYLYGARGLSLAFTKEWAARSLPPDMSGINHDRRAVKVDLLDTSDGKVYETWMPMALELKDFRRCVMDRDWNEVVVESMHDYFYGQHHCPCHRKCDAKAAGADTDGECEGSRFKIQSITAPGCPHVILYSETMTEHELEEALHKAEGREYDMTKALT